MQKCRLNDKPVYAFKVINENNIVNIEYEKMLRRASEQGKLKCEECGADIIFKFGQVKIPHFSHKNDLTGGGCSYSGESEEHIAVKKLLLKLMLDTYPDIYGEMRYRFSNGKWADLYFKFSDGKELVIEFQRELNSLTYWEEKREFYKSNNIKDLWIASGKKEELENILREYEFIFQQRLFLSGNNKLIVLDVNRREIIILSKILIKDNDSGKIIKDEIYSKAYDLKDIKILEDGNIDCSFDEKFNKYKEELLQGYLTNKKRNFEEKELTDKKLKEQEQKIKEEQEISQISSKSLDNYEREDPWKEIRCTPKSFNNKYGQTEKKRYSNYIKDDKYYRDKVNKAILGYRYGKENLVRILKNGGSSDYYNIKRIFEEEIKKGNLKAQRVYEEVIKSAGLSN